MRGVEDELDALPHDATVTITCPPTRGVAATLDLVDHLRGRGHAGRVVPHLAARLVTGPAELERITARLQAAAVREVFVIAGDAAEPAGPYDGASALLSALADQGHDFEDVGVTGYPESHRLIPDATTIQAMFDKAPHATYIVSQICYDPATIRAWVAAVRERGIQLPIHLGIPGVVDAARLLRISARVGLGDSVRFLTSQAGTVGRLLTGYAPDALVDGAVDLFDDPAAGVVGWHLFTFNEIDRTEAWRQERLATARGAH